MEKNTNTGSSKLPASISDARVQTSISGALKFNLDLTSGNQLYQATIAWIESDPNVKAAAIRGGGSDQIALDFRYELPASSDTGGNLVNTVFKPFFDKELGKGALMGWDYANAAAIIK